MSIKWENFDVLCVKWKNVNIVRILSLEVNELELLLNDRQELMNCSKKYSNTLRNTNLRFSLNVWFPMNFGWMSTNLIFLFKYHKIVNALCIKIKWFLWNLFLKLNILNRISMNGFWNLWFSFNSHFNTNQIRFKLKI